MIRTPTLHVDIERVVATGLRDHGDIDRQPRTRSSSEGHARCSGTESLGTLPWRELDSNDQYLARWVAFFVPLRARRLGFKDAEPVDPVE
jgi:hypothetical protein